MDIVSKYGWLIPIKDKTGKSVAVALKGIFNDRRPEEIWVDKGKKFYNKDVQALIELYSTQNEEKSAVVKRWIKIETPYTWPHLMAWWLCKEAILGQGDLNQPR